MNKQKNKYIYIYKNNRKPDHQLSEPKLQLLAPATWSSPAMAMLFLLLLCLAALACKGIFACKGTLACKGAKGITIPFLLVAALSAQALACLVEGQGR